MKISIFKDHFQKEPAKRPVNFYTYLEGIRRGKWQTQVNAARMVLEFETQYKAAKSKAPAVTTSGVFSAKKDSAMVSHSGVLAMDFDAKDNPKGIDKEKLKADPYTHAIHHSIGGVGFVVYVLIDGERHRDAFAALSMYYLNKYGLLVDRGCINESRLRYVSFDPDIYINKKSIQWMDYLPEEKPRRTTTYTATTDVGADLSDLLEQCRRQNIDVCNCYDNRLKTAFAISSELGMAGFSLFDGFCQLHHEYNSKKTDKMFRDALKEPRKPTAATVFYIAKQNGWIKEFTPATTPSTPTQLNKTMEHHAQTPAPDLEYEMAGTKPQPTPPAMDPFSILGFRKTTNGQSFAFYVNAARVVVELAASKMSKSNLLTLAPANWWEMNFPAKHGFSADFAQDWIIQTAYKRGVFDPERLRGRGAWMEKNDVIIHTGQHIIKNGKKQPLNDAKTSFIYEQAPELYLDNTNPMEVEQSRELISLFDCLPFSNGKLDSIFLSGWVALAPVCGLLPWRPHLWLTGAAGTGKTWVLDKIVRRLLGDAVIEVQGETTEAGLRGRLQNDAIPIVFDEAEPTDIHANRKIQSVLSLMRSASADDGGSIIKGNAAGGSTKYTIRSMFAFASIAFAATNESDKSRITKIDLVKTGTKETRSAQFNKLREKYTQLIKPEFISGLQSRIINMVPTILESISVFCVAAAGIVPSQRMADQIGVLFAGCYALTSDKPATLEIANKLLNKYKFDDSAEPETDEQKLYSFILQHLTDVESNGRNVKRSVGELIEIVTTPNVDPLSDEKPAAEKRLKRLGIRVESESGAWGNVPEGENVLVVSNTSIYLRAMLENTPWGNNHGDILKRLEDASPSPRPVSFGAGVVARSVVIRLKDF